MDFRYSTLHPLEGGKNVSVYLIGDVWEPSHTKVLTLLSSAYHHPLRKSDVSRIEAAYQLRRGLRHVLLPKLLDVTFRGRRPGFVTERIQGVSFAERYPPLTVAEAAHFAFQLLDLTAILHRHRYYFGLLTPAKLFWIPDRTVKLNLVFPGTLMEPAPRWVRYQAPECLSGAAPSAAADIYSLGMLLYLVLSGVEPFSETEPAILRQKQLGAFPTALRQMNADVPEHLERVIAAALHKNPDRRPSAAELREELLRYRKIPLETPAPFSGVYCGHSTEVSRLRQFISGLEARDRPQFLTIEAPVGMGKSYIIQRLETECRLLGKVTLALQHRPGFSPFSRLLHLTPSSPGEPNLHRPRSSSGQVSGAQLVSQVITRIREIGETQPLILFASGLNQLDADSLEIYRQIFRLRQVHISIIGALDTGKAAPAWNRLVKEWQATEQFETLALPPLSADRQLRLIRSLVGAPLPESLVTDITRTCEGNPLFITEYLRHLYRQGYLDSEASDPFSTETSRGKAVPRTVARLLRERILKLGKTSRRLVETVALLDRPTTVTLLAAATGLRSMTVLQKVIALEQQGLVETHGGFQAPQVSIRSSWLAQVVRQTVPAKRLIHRHRSIAETLDRFAQNGTHVDPERTARHYMEAQEPERAAPFVREAVQSLKRRGHYRQAAGLFSVAIESGTLDASDWDVVREHLNLLYLSGRLNACQRELERALQGSPVAPEQQMFLQGLRARILANRGEFTAAIDVIESVIAAHGLTPVADSQAELISDLLTCLSRNGLAGKTANLAAFILRDLRKAPVHRAYEKLSHALHLYFYQTGKIDLAIQWEARSARASIRKDHLVRCAGRLFNLGVSKQELGLWSQAERYTHSCLQVAREIGHAELQLYAEIGRLVHLRKTGRHSQARRGLVEALEHNRAVNANPSLETELEIELARNAIYQLDLSEARLRLERIRGSRAIDEVASSQIDASLAEGWTWLSLGEAEKALEIASRTQQIGNPRERGRALLLAGQSRLDLGDLLGAKQDADSALRAFPRSEPYRRAKARLLQAQISCAVRPQRVTGAYILGAIRLCRYHYYAPLLASAYRLKAEWLLHQQHTGLAWACAQRAWRLCERIERPALQAEIQRTLGHIETARSHSDRAGEHLELAIDIYSKSQARLRIDLRTGFHAKFLEPLQIEVAQTRPAIGSPPKSFLIEVREFAQELRQRPSIEPLAHNLFDRVVREFKEVSATLYLYSPTSGDFIADKASGKRMESGREFLPGTNGSPETGIRVVRTRSTWRLVLPLLEGPRTAAFLYLERPGRGFSESEFDFLRTLQLLAELSLDDAAVAAQSPIPDHPALQLADGTAIIGRHPLMLAIFDQIRSVAQSDTTVLIWGESGTGKELVAKAIHQASRRAPGPFIPVNCAALPADLIENELFGHEQGSYTGASEATKGLFQAAHGGTLFLDEISAMPLPLQANLLRVLDSKRVRRIGGTKEQAIDVRIVAATNQDLLRLIEANQFRRDLFHRLDVFRMVLPALRQRRSDLPLLCDYFLSHFNADREHPLQITPEALKRLEAYPFPGNVRELKNLLESLHYTLPRGPIRPSDLRSRMASRGDSPSTGTRQHRLRRVVEAMANGTGSFRESVQEPFLRRDLSRHDVRAIVAMGLEACGGNYRKVVASFGLPPDEYKRFMAFLSNHGCRVDFRPYRPHRQK